MTAPKIRSCMKMCRCFQWLLKYFCVGTIQEHGLQPAYSISSPHLSCQESPSCRGPGNMQKRKWFHLEKNLKSTELQWAKLLTLSPSLSRIEILMLFSFGNKILSLPCRYPFSLYSSIVTGIQFKMFKTLNSSKGSVKLHLTHHRKNKQALIYFRSGVFLHSH